jgi:hypothetical protein
MPASRPDDYRSRRVFLRQKAAELMAQAGDEHHAACRFALLELAFVYWRVARELEDREARR